MADIALDDSTVDSMVALVTALDGLPLAVELVAATAHARPIGELVESVQEHVGGRAAAARGRAPRHVSLNAAIDWSVSQLDELHRHALAALSCATSPIAKRTVIAALASLGVGDDADSLLGTLSARCLLVQDPHTDTVRLYETVQAFAQQMPELNATRSGVVGALVDDCVDACGDIIAVGRSIGHDAARVAPTGMRLLYDETVPGAQRQRLAFAFATWLTDTSPHRALDILARALAWDDSDPVLLARLHIGLSLVHGFLGETSQSDSVADGAEPLVESTKDGELRIELEQLRTRNLMMRGGAVQAGDAAERALTDPTLSQAARSRWTTILAVARAWHGDHEAAVRVLTHALVNAEQETQTAWRMLLAPAQLAIGQHQEALRTAVTGLDHATPLQRMNLDETISRAVCHLHPSSLHLGLWLRTIENLTRGGWYVSPQEMTERTTFLDHMHATLGSDALADAERIVKTLDNDTVHEMIERLGRQALNECEPRS
ncbi:MAG: hypothetical protein JOY80_01830 [Candidatus Dormibacteraeota bacterium]|nr:hypothetical protein [Candidatus Dormibacteraeota bacterium]